MTLTMCVALDLKLIQPFVDCKSKDLDLATGVDDKSIMDNSVLENPLSKVLVLRERKEVLTIHVSQLNMLFTISPLNEYCFVCVRYRTGVEMSLNLRHILS